MGAVRSQWTNAGRITGCVVLGSTVAWLIDRDPLWAGIIAASVSTLILSWATRFSLGWVSLGPAAALRLVEGTTKPILVHPARRRLRIATTFELEGVGDCTHAPNQMVVVGKHPTPVQLFATSRGRATTLTFKLESRAPFGMLRHARRIAVPADVWALPAPRPVREHMLHQLLEIRPRGLDHSQPSGPGDAEFHSLREFREGDPERRVSPRASARRGRKILRLFRGEAPPQLHVVLDQRVPIEISAFERTDFEEAVRFVAGVIRAVLLHEIPVRLSLLGRHGLSEAVPASCRDLDAFLAALALAKADARGEDDPLDLSIPPPSPISGPTPVIGRGLLIHLGALQVTSLPRGWTSVRAGSKLFYQLLEPQIR